jgi:glycosyltransferase involved in cell wall biosynthesis
MASASPRRRFAMVCPNYYPVTCGVGDYSMRLGRELIERGTEVALFTHSPAVRNPECPAVDVYAADGRTPLAVTAALREAIAAFDPTDLVVQYTPQMLHGSRFGTLAIPALMAQFRGRSRLTVILHELYMSWSWRPDLALGGVFQRLQFGAVVGAADRLFVTTAPRQRRMEQLFQRVSWPCHVDLLFVGANASPLAAHRTRSTRRLGIFSMMGRNRRFDLMVDALPLILEKHPGTELVLIGDLGTEASPLFRALQAHIGRSPVARRIRRTGPVTLSRVAEEVAALDVYILPDEAGISTRSSTLPVALGSGIPVVGTRGPETADDFFVDGESVVYANGMSASALAEAVLRLLDDPELAAKVGAGGRSLYERHLAWPAIAGKLLATS